MSAMKSPGCAALTATLFGAAVGCANQEPAAGIVSIAPASAYNDQAFAMTILGSGFRPIYQVDTTSGTATTTSGGFALSLSPTGGAGGERVEADQVTWEGSTQLEAELPAQIPAGIYDVVVRDPRGNAAVLADGFMSLGPDVTPPVVTFQQPATGTLVGGGTLVDVSLSANDRAGVNEAGTIASLTWMVTGPDAPTGGSCSVPPMSPAVTCGFSFPAPAPDSDQQTLTVSAVATDEAGNAGTAEISLEVAPQPMLSSVVPGIGPASGGTALTVVGSNFLAGSTAILVDGKPLATTVTGTTMLSASTDPHDPGNAILMVGTAGANVYAGMFLFIATPIVRAVFPPQAPAAGGTPVSVVGDGFRAATTITFGDAPLRCPLFVNANRIDGFTPAGGGVEIVTAHDPVSGTGSVVYFTYQDDPDGGAPAGDGGATGCPPGGVP